MSHLAVMGTYLPTFLAVAEEATFAQAAEALGVTQPAVSYRMARLEEELSTTLLERAGRRMILTPAGRELHAFCRRYADELEDLAARLAEQPPPVRDPVRIAAVSGFGRYVVFPALCSPSLREMPAELIFATADDVFARVERGDADLGVVYRPKVTSYLDMRELCQEELVLIAPAEGYDLPASPTLEDLEALPFVTYVESGYVFGAWFEHYFGRQPAGLRAYRRFEELEEVVIAVGLQSGLSIVPLDCAGEALRRGRVRIVQPEGRPCSNRVYTVRRSGTYVHPHVETVVEAVRARGCLRTESGTVSKGKLAPPEGSR